MFFSNRGHQSKETFNFKVTSSSVTIKHNCYSRYLGMHGNVNSELWISFGKRLLLLMSNIHTL